MNYIFWNWSKFTTAQCSCSCISITTTCYQIYSAIFFKVITEVRFYNTRQHSHYHVPMCRLAQTAKNIRYVRVKCSAVFRMNLSYCSSPHCYKKAVKDILLTQESWNFNLFSLLLICSDMHGLLITELVIMYRSITGSVRPVLTYVKSHNLIIRND